MKTLPKFYKGNEDTVLAYQDSDLLDWQDVFVRAEAFWYSEWEKQGARDEGTCCGGKGIRVWYAGPRKQSAELIRVINSPPCQGNVSAYRSVGPALEFLKEIGVDAEYYDGWMD